MGMIYDGTGSNRRAAVNSENRLKVDAVTEDSYVHAAEEGRAFNLNTGEVAYSGTGPYETGCLYVKNNETTDIEIVGWFIGERGNRVGSDTSEPLLFTLYGNPTGSLGGNVVDIVNRRIGAPRQFNVDALSSPTGWSVSGTPLLYQYHYSGSVFGNVNFTIPPGQSIIITVTSRTDSFSAYTGFTGYITGDA